MSHEMEHSSSGGSILANNITQAKGNRIYTTYGSRNLVTSNNYFRSNMYAGLNITNPEARGENGGDYEAYNIMNFFTTDILNFTMSGTSGCSTPIDYVETYGFKNAITGSYISYNLGDSGGTHANEHFFRNATPIGNSFLYYTGDLSGFITYKADTCTIGIDGWNTTTYSWCNFNQLNIGSFNFYTYREFDCLSEGVEDPYLRFESTIWNLTSSGEVEFSELMNLTEISFIKNADNHYTQTVEVFNVAPLRFPHSSLQSFKDRWPFFKKRFDRLGVIS